MKGTNRKKFSVSLVESVLKKIDMKSCIGIFSRNLWKEREEQKRTERRKKLLKNGFESKKE